MLTVISAASLAACSSGNGSSTTTTVARGAAVLGTPYTVWVAVHPPITVGGVSGYGRTVSVAGDTAPEFTDVHQLDGRVISFHMTLPATTHIAAAEQLVRAQLPSDARQTASWRGSFRGDPAASCEFVNYQSTILARSLGIAPPPPSSANIGTSLYERSAHRPGSPSISTVNSADLSTTANTVGESC